MRAAALLPSPSTASGVCGSSAVAGETKHLGGCASLLRSGQAAGPLAYFSSGSVAVHGQALAVLDDVGPSHPDVGHQVAGTGPDQVTQKLRVIDRRGETGVIG